MKRVLLASVFLALPISVKADIQVGSVAIYSNGSVEKLIDKTAEWTLWQDQRRRLYKRSRFPFLPNLSYQKYPDPSLGFSQYLVSGNPEDLKPVGTENKIDFELMKKTPSSTSKKYWKCSFKGEGSFKLRKKRVTTEDYHCERWIFSKAMIPRTGETVELKYSPKLGLVVDRKRQTSKGKKTQTKLVRVLGAEKATAKRIARTVYKLRNEK